MFGLVKIFFFKVLIVNFISKYFRNYQFENRNNFKCLEVRNLVKI